VEILLIRPSWEYPFTKEEATYNRVWVPLELATTASVLEKDGHKVSILDAHALRLPPNEVAMKAADFDKVFISSSSYDRWQCPNVNLAPFYETVKHVKAKNEWTYVLGYHGTVKPETLLPKTRVKALVQGEPEYTIKEICKDVELSNINGLSYLDGDEVVSNARRDLINLDELPKPSLHLLDISKYFYEALGDNFTIFEGSRGCPFSCNFCVLTMFNNKYRKKSAEKLIEEVDDAVLNQGVKNGYFMDLEFTINKKLVNAVCNHLIEKDYDFQWTCQTRADSVNPEMLALMKKAKCRLVHFGVESGSEPVLESTNKKITLEKIEAGVKMTHEAGIRVMCFFLFGLPGETEEDIKKTVKFAKKLNPHYASFHIVLPYPGTKLYADSVIPNELENLDKGMFPMDFKREVPLPNLQKILKRAMISYYLRPSYIFRAIMNGTLTSPIKLLMIFLKRINQL